MDKAGMPRDERVKGSRGRYETRPVAVGVGGVAGTEIVRPNGARVALIFSAVFDTATADTKAIIGALGGATAPAVLVLAPGMPSYRMGIETHGDMVSALSLQVIGTELVGLYVWEVIWHPEDR